MTTVKRINLPDASNCMGCNNCVVSCRQNAIQLKYDFWGRTYPTINHNLCVKCRQCECKCPENTKSTIERKNSQSCYAVIADKSTLEQSSSGGFASGLSKHIIRHKGIVVGAAFDSFPRCQHIIVDNEADLSKLQKSKYIYSHLDNILPRLKKMVKEYPDKTIVFFGVPCQIAAAKNIIGNNPNILYVEILCHGTMPDFIFPKYIKGIEKKYRITATNFNFKGDKTNSDYLVYQSPQIKVSENKDINLTRWYKWFLVSFLEGYAYKTKCYHCNYVGTKRIGDITIGDFWGLGKSTPFNYNQRDGVSVVLLNTEKGENAFQKIRHSFAIAEERPISEPVIQNQTLSRPTPIPTGNKLYQLLLILLPWKYLLSFHKARFYWLKISRALSWHIKKILIRG